MFEVTAILSVYNGEKYLGEAIESILAQTYGPIETIIVDDGSQDGTAQIAKRGGVRYVYQENQGQPCALNRGLSMAQGRYISFLDADDLYMPEKIALQVKFLQANPEVDFVFGYAEQFHSPELSSEEKKKWACPTEITPGYLAAAGLFRKECFERVGSFNEKQRIGVFIEWYMRAVEMGLQHDLITKKVLRRRIHNHNMGIYAQHSRVEYVRIVKEALKRRQLAGIL